MTPHGLLLPLLLLTLLLAARSGAALARCPGCGQAVQAGCPGGCVEEDGGPPAEGCKEAGGCLRREGQQCGVYTPNCAPGLQCQPPEEDEAPLRALLLGRGRCHRARASSGENPKESKPQAGTTRPQDVNRRDQQRNQGTSTTPARPSPGVVQDTEMVCLRMAGSRRGGEPQTLPSEAIPLGLEKSPTCILGAWLVAPGEYTVELDWTGSELPALPSPRAPAADIWTRCCSNSRPRCTEGLRPSTCQTVTIGASTGSGSVAPPRASAEVLAGVWIGWASPCQGPQKVMEALPAPPGSVAKAGGWELQDHWQEHGAVILGHLLSDE
uniref:IGFBP N-terminal domain-containing protein n=1 Tax=Suricata suricatta TaxID=37032 RepID=A0A673TDG8_SURSU